MKRYNQKNSFHLIAYPLCPYVQRSVITLEEKSVPYRRTDIDLANKPEWFKQLSPMGKVPLLVVENSDVIFESTVICEYLDEITQNSLLPKDAMDKAYNRSWIEFANSSLNLVSKLYSVKTKSESEQVQKQLTKQFKQVNLEFEKKSGDYFNGEKFSLVDAAFAPLFRYFDVLEQYVELSYIHQPESILHWRKCLTERISVQKAVNQNYPVSLISFIKKKGSHLSRSLKHSTP